MNYLDKFFSKTELLNLYKLKNLIRYNNKTRLKDENVAEHSYYVAIIGLKLCDKFKLNNNIRLKVITKALLHDMPEMYINDITHDAKIILDINDNINKFERYYYMSEYPKYTTLMKQKKDLVSTIVVIADILSAKQYILNEMALGNQSLDIVDIDKQLDARLKEQYELLINFKEIKEYEAKILGN